MLKKLTLLAAIMLPAPLSAETVKVDKDRLITILGVVDRSITAEAGKLLSMASPTAEEKKPIWILVNSPGGSVNSGMLFINAMSAAKARGYELSCISGKLAASMGFHILVNCSSVVTLPNTMLLFHAPFIPSAGKLDAPTARYLAREMSFMENQFIEDLLKATKISRNKMIYHFRKETFWTGERLAKETDMIKVVTNIEGIDDVLYSRGQPNFGISFRVFQRSKEILYIHPEIFKTFYN